MSFLPNLIRDTFFRMVHFFEENLGAPRYRAAARWLQVLYVLIFLQLLVLGGQAVLWGWNFLTVLVPNVFYFHLTLLPALLGLGWLLFLVTPRWVPSRGKRAWPTWLGQISIFLGACAVVRTLAGWASLGGLGGGLEYLKLGANWLRAWDYFELFFVFDNLRAVFLLLTHFLLVICLILLLPTLGVDPKGVWGVGALFLLWVQLIFTFLAGDLFLFFLAFERLMIPLLLLIGIWGSPNRLQANNYLYFYTTVGAVGMFLAILYLGVKFESTNLVVLSAAVFDGCRWAEKVGLWLGFFLSFAIKTPLVPFHIWLPKAHVEAPTTGSVILAGLLLKIGLYGLLRINLGLFYDVRMWAASFVSTLAVVGLIYASLITLRQVDMKRIIAYSSVAHMSLAFARVMTGSVLGISAGVFLSLSHGIVSRALFILVGALYARFHNRLVTYYGGLVTWMPQFTVVFAFFSLANMAFPLTSGFMGEFLCLTAILAQNTLLGVVAASSMLFRTVYAMLLFNRVFLGRLKLHLQVSATTRLRALDLTWNEGLILWPCVALTVYFGIYPSALLFFYPLPYL